MKNHLTGIFFFLFLFHSTVLSQEYQFNTESKKALKFYQKAEKAYVDHELADALHYLQKAVAKDSAFIEAWLLMGDINSDMKEYANAIKAYNEVIEIDPDFFPLIYYWIGNAHLSLKEFDEASNNFEKFLEYPDLQGELRQKVKNKLKDSRFRAKAYENPVPFDPRNLGKGINTDADEYINAITTEGNTLIFTRRTLRDSSRENNLYKENIFQSTIDSQQTWQKAVEMNPTLSLLGNIGALTLSPDGMYLFFVVCSSAQGYGSCDLFYMIRQGDGWSEPANLGPIINSTAWDSQPAFSSDGRTLYFASNRYGGKGSSDIYVSKLQDDGHWSEPHNIGNPINTAAAEMAPFIHPDDQTLYFSSKGHTGMGGSDLFLSRLMKEGLWHKPENLGYPINTESDEINIIVSPDASTAYISSDQLEGRGGFDIYGFPLYKEIRPKAVTYLKGKVYDAETLEPLQANLQLLDIQNGNIRTEAFSDKDNGEFILVIPVGRNYALNVSKKGYLFYSDHFSLADVRSRKNPYFKNIPLQPLKAGKSLVLKNIFYETDKYKLKDESKVELNKLQQFLNKNPGVKLEIGGHTDNRGTAAYNLELSRKRAQSVYSYLIEHGITEERLSYKGYGYSEPVAGNETAEGRAMNRRTEITVLD